MRIVRDTFILCILLTAISFAGKFKLPVFDKVILDNGLTVYLMEQHEVPLIYLSALIPCGAIQDGAKNGLAFLTSESLLYGTENYSKKQIEETFEFYGANISTSAYSEFIKLNASFAKQDQEKLLPILQDIILNPTFPDDEVQKRKQRLLVELDQAKESPRQVIRSYFNKFLFADNEFGNPVLGLKNTVSDISSGDLEHFYQSFFKPANSAIALVGDFNSSEMKKIITELFQSWKTEEDEISSSILIPTLDFNKSRVLLVNKNDAKETTFLIGGKGVSRDNPDFTEIQVINTILGDRFTSWLNEELRINSGLTYGARSAFMPFKNLGTFFISTFTGTQNTERAIDLALQVLNRLHTTGITDKVLKSAKNYIKGQFPPDYETAGALADLLTSMKFYGFDERYINNFEDTVDKLTVTKANEIVKKYFPKDNLQFAIIGKASEIRNIVKKYGDVTEKEILEDGF
ncbi:MAG: insulinase family protein [Ignavibacteriaceae bacterium]|nr:insulinase family protein [Ignavibacteriaceae bacterium]